MEKFVIAIGPEYGRGGRGIVWQTRWASVITIRS